MTLSIRQAQARKMAEVRAALARPQFVYIVCRILVHEPAPTGSRRCPCCGSTSARIAEQIDDGEVLIHPAPRGAASGASSFVRRRGAS